MAFDNNVNRVCQAFQDRAYIGYKKYGTTTERTDINLLGWLQHLQEELMDAVVYIERLKGEVNDCTLHADSKERQLPNYPQSTLPHV